MIKPESCIVLYNATLHCARLVAEFHRELEYSHSPGSGYERRLSATALKILAGSGGAK